MRPRRSNHQPGGFSRLARSRLAQARGAESEVGQALIMALIVVMVVALLPAIVISSLLQQIDDANRSVSYEAALAAAQAGLQEYRNLLNQYTGYYTISGAAGKTIPSTEGGPNPALYGWESVPNANPAEAFTYSPYTGEVAQVPSSANPFGGDVLLVVTGKAGIGTARAYRRIEASFNLSGVLTDVYYSNFEQPGAGDINQWENTYSGGALVQSGADEFDEATATTPAGYGVESYAAALCQYDADSPNTFVDWYSTQPSPIGKPVYPPNGYPGSAPYSASNPYFGPWYGNWTDPLNTSMQFGNAPTSGNANGNHSACNENYYIGSNTFNGPVYSQDELTTCYSPTFTGTPSLETAVPSGFPFPAGWPGAQPASGGTSAPYGYVDDPWKQCGTPGSTADTPNLTDPAGVSFGVQQSLPPIEDSLAAPIESGQSPGCIYTGPTMIRFYWNAATATETMDVWSPLTKDTYASLGASCGAIDTSGTAGNPGDLCGGAACTYSGGVATNTQVCAVAVTNCAVKQVAAGNFAQITLVKPEVIWVQATPTTATDPNYWAPSALPTAEYNSTAPNCIDPWINPGPTTNISATTCGEGDLVVGGAIGGEITLGSANNVVLSSSLVYDCALNSNGSYQNTLTNCGGSASSIGLIADSSIWLARPAGAPLCTASDVSDLPLSSVSWNNISPVYCDVQNPIIDGATAALSGFFEDQNWTTGANNGNIYFNGADAVNNAGQYGTFNGTSIVTGYNLELSYDPRLLVDPPPQYVQATDSVWLLVGWVTCGNTSPNPDTDPTTATGFSYADWASCSALPGSYAAATTSSTSSTTTTTTPPTTTTTTTTTPPTTTSTTTTTTTTAPTTTTTTRPTTTTTTTKPSNGVTATPSSSNYGNYGGAEFLTTANTSSITAMTIVIKVQQTTGVTYSSQSNSYPGGDITQTNATSGGVITYTAVLNSGQVIPSGTNADVQDQWGGTGSVRVTSGDTWTITTTSGGVVSTLSGTF